MKVHPIPLTVALVASASLVAVAAPAQAGGSDVVRRGACAGSTDWKLKVGPEDGRLEVEGEIDSNRVGQSWAWQLVHNGALAASGTATTAAPSGSFTVRRLMANRAGVDTITLRARNQRSGELCVGTVRF